jgi:hypothetical protein
LLCLLLPATDIPVFRLDRPDQTDERILSVLKQVGTGSGNDVARSIVGGLDSYLTTYTRPGEDGRPGPPDFSGGSYFYPANPGEEPTDEQLSQDVVESYAISVQLTLAALGFTQILKSTVVREETRAAINSVEERCRTRLSAALMGLLRSFSISVFTVDSNEGQLLLRTVNQDNLPPNLVADDLRRALREPAAGLRDLDLGVDPETLQRLDNPDLLFECGWSWGITETAPPVKIGSVADETDGPAENLPYLYFTIVALDSIAELDSDRTRLLNLLNEDQLTMATGLRLRFTLTQNYWATIASFGRGRWPLEDIPWKTTDGLETDFYSLLVASISARGLAAQRGNDSKLARLGNVLAELANRARITRRPFADDPALLLHAPGVTVRLEGPGLDDGPPIHWVGTDFAQLLLKRSLAVAELITTVESRTQLLELVDRLWDHIDQRRLNLVDDVRLRDVHLWDQPKAVFPTADVAVFQHVSWHHTLRVVESLVIAAHLVDSEPLTGDTLRPLAKELLAEAEHLYDKELLAGSTESGRKLRDDLDQIIERVRRAREVSDERPGSAIALLTLALAELDKLAAARTTRGKQL